MTDQLSGGVVQPTDARLVTLNAQQQALLHRMLDWHAAVVRFGAESPSAFKHFATCAALAVPQAPLQAEPVPVVASEPVAWWIPEAEQFTLANRDGSRPFAKAWQPLYATPQAEPAVAEQAREALRLADAIDPFVRKGLDNLTLAVAAKFLRALAAQPAVAEQAREPIARLHVSMERHDMGQSLAPPPPPYKFARANALAIAETMPVGTYDLVLASQSTPPPADGKEIA